MDKQDSEFVEYLKLWNKTELEYNGIESDDEMESLESDEPYGVQTIRIAQKMISVFQIEHWISAQNGVRLYLSPESQRTMIWDHARKSALIESLLLRIPIPAIYLDEDHEGNKNVMDGRKRLSTIHSYMNNEFALENMQYLPHCEKKYFRDLDVKLRGRIEDTELAVNILDEKCPQIVKFDILRRVHTGGIPLNLQEVRNIMALPKVRVLLQKMAQCEEFQQATQRRVKDLNLRAQELCLRYLTVLFAYDWEHRNFRNDDSLLTMMDQMIIRLNHWPEEKLNQLFQTFRLTMLNCEKILGKDSFCKKDHNKINKSLFVGWSVVLSNVKPDTIVLQENTQKIRFAYREILTPNTEFYRTITSSPGTRNNILRSVGMIRELWENCYDKFYRD